MNKNLQTTILFVAVIISVSLSVWVKLSEKKIGYVRMSKLVDEYKGMKEAQASFKQKTEGWQSNLDTLEMDYQRSLREYNTVHSKLNPAERKEREEQLQKQQMNIRQYVQTLEQKAKEEDSKLTGGVLNQINSFVEEYGNQHGYDMIFGVTVTGNVMQADESLDLTEEISKKLNADYSDEKKK
jgi:outer membrane protein